MSSCMEDLDLRMNRYGVSFVRSLGLFPSFPSSLLPFLPLSLCMYLTCLLYPSGSDATLLGLFSFLFFSLFPSVQDSVYVFT